MHLSENEFRTVVKNYMIFYNEKRPHIKNRYKTLAKRKLEFLVNKLVNQTIEIGYWNSNFSLFIICF